MLLKRYAPTEFADCITGGCHRLGRMSKTARKVVGDEVQRGPDTLQGPYPDERYGPEDHVRTAP